MPPSQATLLAKIQSLEKRVDGLAAKVKADEKVLDAVLGMSPAQLNALASLSAAQLTALTTFSASVLNDMSAIFDAQWVALAGLSGAQLDFLGGLSQLPNQSDNNTTLAGVETFCNNLSDHLQAHGFMHS